MATTSGRVTVVLADDDEHVRAALRDLFEEARGIDVVAEAATAQEAVARVEAHSPDVVILDVRMPGDGLAAARRITMTRSSTQVVVLTAHDTPEHRDEAAAAGAARFVLKSDGDDLVSAVLDAAGG